MLPRAERDAETAEGSAQELVAQFLQTPTAFPSSSVEEIRNVVVQGEGRFHASRLPYGIES